MAHICINHLELLEEAKEIVELQPVAPPGYQREVELLEHLINVLRPKEPLTLDMISECDEGCLSHNSKV